MDNPTVPVDNPRVATLENIARVGEEMRAAQTQYFATRSPLALTRAQMLERRFDALVAAVRHSAYQPSLIPAPDEVAR